MSRPYGVSRPAVSRIVAAHAADRASGAVLGNAAHDQKGFLLVNNASTDPDSQKRPADALGTRRIWIGGAVGAMLAGCDRVLDFWPVGATGSLGNAMRGLFDLASILFLLPVAGFVVGLLIAAGIALWRGNVWRGASSIAAIIAIPICLTVVARVSLFDPWFCYALANRERFEVLAASDSVSKAREYAVIEIRDVSTGITGSPDHFVALIYDESDTVDLEPSKRPSIWRTRGLWPSVNPTPIPRGKRLFGNFFRVDEFE